MFKYNCIFIMLILFDSCINNNKIIYFIDKLDNKKISIKLIEKQSLNLIKSNEAYILELKDKITLKKNNQFYINLKSNYYDFKIELLNDSYNIIETFNLTDIKDINNSNKQFNITLKKDLELKYIKFISLKQKNNFKIIEFGQEKKSGNIYLKEDNLIIYDVSLGYKVNLVDEKIKLLFDLNRFNIKKKEDRQIKFKFNYNYVIENTDTLLTDTNKDKFLEKQKYNIKVSFYKDGKVKKIINMRPRSNSRTIYFYSNALGFIPDSIEFSFDKILKFEIKNFNLYYFNDFYFKDMPDYYEKILNHELALPFPITIDIGQALNYPHKNWRQDDFEIFNWNLYNKILIFDFKDLNTQALFLKRLAFYIEKIDYRGVLLENEQLEDKHGWNAHDYNSYGLASFFNNAIKNDFKLNKQELFLKRILIVNKIIYQKKDGFLKALKGGIISVSRASSQEDRLLLLSHETYHGLFFMNESLLYNKVLEIINNLNDDIYLIKKYLFFRSYDIDYDYLFINEVFAYTLQQRYSVALNYYQIKIKDVLIRSFPKDRKYIENINIDEYNKLAYKLNMLIYNNFGILGGEISDTF